MTLRSTAPGLLLIFAFAGAAWADDAPWNRGDARAEARRVAEQARSLLRATEMRDARPALQALSDGSWQLRQLGILRLQTLGLPPRWVQGLAPLAALEAKPPEPDWPPLVAAREYADALEVAGTQPPELSLQDAIQTLVGLIASRLIEGRDPPAQRSRLLHELLAFAPLLPPPGRVWLCLSALAAVDEAQVLRDLHREDLAGVVGEQGQPALEWFARNHAYLYWHPRLARFRVDVAARRAGEPSAAFRERTPWGRGEGPASER